MIIVAIVSFIVQWRFKSKFNQYAEIGLLSGLSGKDVAERMLMDNQICDVEVVSVEGQLTDHYNPETKTVNLSPDVYIAVVWLQQQWPRMNADTQYNTQGLTHG